jgi:hypothetical protein
MKWLVATTIRVALACVAGAAISLIPVKAADANIRLAEQSCEVQADEQNLTGAEKDSFLFKCQSGIGIPSAMPITTGNQPSRGADGQWRGRNSVRPESYWFCNSLVSDDCVWVKIETGITPVGVQLAPPGMPISTGA